MKKLFRKISFLLWRKKFREEIEGIDFECVEKKFILVHFLSLYPYTKKENDFNYLSMAINQKVDVAFSNSRNEILKFYLRLPFYETSTQNHLRTLNKEKNNLLIINREKIKVVYLNDNTENYSFEYENQKEGAIVSKWISIEDYSEMIFNRKIIPYDCLLHLSLDLTVKKGKKKHGCH